MDSKDNKEQYESEKTLRDSIKIIRRSSRTLHEFFNVSSDAIAGLQDSG